MASEVSGMFLAMVGWYEICKGGFGTRLAISEKTLKLSEKNSVGCRLSPLESPVYLNN